MLPENEFERDKKVDRNMLEIENELMPSLYAKWSRRAADAKFEKDKAETDLEILKSEKEKECAFQKHSLDLVEGRLLIEVKKDPTQFFKEEEKIPKISSDATAMSIVIKQEEYKIVYDTYLKAKYYIEHKDYKEAIKKLNEAKRDARMLESASKAMDMKRSSIKYLGDLFLGGYWSTDMRSPKIGEDINRGKAESEDTLTEKLEQRKRRRNDE